MFPSQPRFLCSFVLGGSIYGSIENNMQLLYFVLSLYHNFSILREFPAQSVICFIFILLLQSKKEYKPLDECPLHRASESSVICLFVSSRTRFTELNGKQYTGHFQACLICCRCCLRDFTQQSGDNVQTDVQGNMSCGSQVISLGALTNKIKQLRRHLAGEHETRGGRLRSSN